MWSFFSGNPSTASGPIVFDANRFSPRSVARVDDPDLVEFSSPHEKYADVWEELLQNVDAPKVWKLNIESNNNKFDAWMSPRQAQQMGTNPTREQYKRIARLYVKAMDKKRRHTAIYDKMDEEKKMKDALIEEAKREVGAPSEWWPSHEGHLFENWMHQHGISLGPITRTMENKQNWTDLIRLYVGEMNRRRKEKVENQQQQQQQQQQFRRENAQKTGNIIWIKKLAGGTFPIRLDGDTNKLHDKIKTIGDIKQKIEEKAGLPKRYQRLVFQRRQLANDNQTLENAGIKPQATVHLLEKSRDGSLGGGRKTRRKKRKRKRKTRKKRKKRKKKRRKTRIKR